LVLMADQDKHSFIHSLLSRATSQTQGARRILVINVVLLALTAHLFRTSIFNLQPAAVSDCPVDARCATLDANTTHSSGFCTYTSLGPDGSQCVGFEQTNLRCFQNHCLPPNDRCVAVECSNPPDAECSAPTGSCSNGVCNYQALADGTRCGGSVSLGRTCLSGICASPARTTIRNYAFEFAIYSGITTVALALEVLFTQTATSDLAALSINFGALLLGFTAKHLDIGVVTSTGIGRTQAAFGIIAGSFSILFGGRWLHQKRDVAHETNNVGALGLVVFWGVALGLAATTLSFSFNDANQGIYNPDSNVEFYFAQSATYVAAAVNLAFAHNILNTGSFTKSFLSLSCFTAIVALAFVSAWYQGDKLSTTKAHARAFTDTAVAWASFVIISTALSVVLWVYFLYKGGEQKPHISRVEHPKEALAKPRSALNLALNFVLIGLVAKLFQKHYFDRNDKVYGNDPLVVNPDNYGNIVSAFAWPVSIWAATVACSRVVGGLAAAEDWGIQFLNVLFSITLVGFASQHTVFALDQNGLSITARAWAGLALVTGSVNFVVHAHNILKAVSHAEATVTPVHHEDVEHH